MKLTAQLTSMQSNPVEYFVLNEPGIIDEDDFATLAEIEQSLEGMELDEPYSTSEPLTGPVRH